MIGSAPDAGVGFVVAMRLRNSFDLQLAAIYPNIQGGANCMRSAGRGRDAQKSALASL
jgi:hypothetical protein